MNRVTIQVLRSSGEKFEKHYACSDADSEAELFGKLSRELEKTNTLSLNGVQLHIFQGWKHSVDYAKAGVTPGSHAAIVFLDGRRVENAHEANATEGWVKVIEIENNQPSLKKLEGKVEIYLIEEPSAYSYDERSGT